MCGSRTHPACAAGLKSAPCTVWEYIPQTHVVFEVSLHTRRYEVTRLEGFEPTTTRLKAVRSDQLSYKRELYWSPHTY